MEGKHSPLVTNSIGGSGCNRVCYIVHIIKLDLLVVELLKSRDIVIVWMGASCYYSSSVH